MCEVPQTGMTSPVYLEKGCVPGRSDIPDRFRMLLGEVIEAAQAKWEEVGLGVTWA